MLKSFIKLCWIFPLLAACSQGNWTIDLNSLQNTLEKARPGDTIYIKSGTYTNIQLQLEGYGRRADCCYDSTTRQCFYRRCI